LTLDEFKGALKENNIDYNEIVSGSYLKCVGSPNPTKYEPVKELYYKGLFGLIDRWK
jgi:hypothetical protein